MLELELPFPPSVNHYYRRVGPRTLISREGRAYREKVCAILAASCVPTFSGPVEVKVELYPPDRRRRDVDNALKSLLDALEKGGAYRNDSQIVTLVARKRKPVEGGLAIVRIEEAEDPPPRARSVLSGAPLCPGGSFGPRRS
jgi:crossover junction endodeoxyribonuclease RusA